jgi:tetratricopeptide (TPR) repeat protein
MSRFSNLELSGGGKQRPEMSVRTGNSAVPRDEADYLAQAEEAQRGARFEMSMRYFSRALEFNPNCRPGWCGQVRALLELGELTEARMWSEKALELFADHNELLASRAVACARLGDPAKAMAFSDAAIQQKSPTPWVWISRGEIMLASSRGTEAFCFDKARELAASDWWTLLGVARSYLAYGVGGRALQWAREAQSLKPDAAFASHVVGACNQLLGLDDAARHAYRQALELDQGFPLSAPALRSLDAQTWHHRLFARLRAWRNR